MTKIVDCFTFFNELKILEFRLEELNDYVDHFVIVEANRSHSGEIKPLFFQDNKHRFSKFLHKITHIVVDDMPYDEREQLPHITDGELNNNYGFKAQQAWVREGFQRNCIMRGVEQLNLSDDDYLIVSDCDEIVNPELLKQLKIYGSVSKMLTEENNNKLYSPRQENVPLISDYDEMGIVGLIMDYYNYNLECKNRGTWWFARLLTYKTFKEFYVEPMFGNAYGEYVTVDELPDDFKFKSRMRVWTGAVDAIRRCDLTNIYLINAGWHFSYFGGVDAIKTKLKNFAHQEYNLAPDSESTYLNDEVIAESIALSRDLYDREFMHFEHFPLEKNKHLPKNYRLLL